MDTLDRRRVLLVHPLGYPRGEADSDVSRLANVMPPLGLAMIAAYLEQQGVPTSIVDCYAHPHAESEIMERLRRDRPGFVGFSCTTATFLDGVRLAARVKAVQPGSFTVFGGPHVSALKEQALADYPAIDFAVVGEGELTMTALVKSGGRTPQEIPGLVYRRDDGAVSFSGYRDNLLPLDELPFPAYHKLPGFPHDYKLPVFNYPSVPHATCVSSRGCPYACSYCDRSVFWRTFRHNSAKYMVAHMIHLSGQYGVKHVNFYDDQFTFNRERVMSFCRGLRRSNLSMTFNCAARSEHLDLELLHEMKAAGCWMISIGIETGDPKLLAQHRSHADLEQVTRAIHLIKKAGIRVKGLFMIGLPGETATSVRRSIQYMLSQPIDDVNVAKFTPFPGSPLYDHIADKGQFSEDWQAMDCMTFVFIPKGLTHSELNHLFDSFYKAHFMRLRTIWNYITMIWRSPDSWRRFWTHFHRFVSFAVTRRRFRHGAASCDAEGAW